MTRVLLSPSRRHAFGKTSIASTGDIDFFLPDTGPLSTESYRKRLTTSMGTKQVKLPKSGVQVRATGLRPLRLHCACRVRCSCRGASLQQAHNSAACLHPWVGHAFHLGDERQHCHQPDDKSIECSTRR